MLKALEKCMATGEMVEVYCLRNRYDSFAVGIVIRVSKSHTLMKSYGKSGEYDGYYLIRTGDVFRVETESQYLEKILKLKNGMKFDGPDVELEGDILTGILESAINANFVVDLKINYGNEAWSIIGYVKALEDDKVIIDQLLSDGTKDGQTIFGTKEIVRMYVDDVSCRDIAFLSMTEQTRRT